VKLVIGSDHAGLKLKEAIVAHLEKGGFEVSDFGTYDETSVDYPDFARMVAGSVSRGEAARGILVCGSGVGMSVAANKYPGVRAALVEDVETARQSRAHVDSNVVVFGGRQTDAGGALPALDAWLETPFEGGRHLRRVEKIRAIEEEVAAEASKSRSSR
jgi:ribose 5-phosphate isomerase B